MHSISKTLNYNALLQSHTAIAFEPSWFMDVFEEKEEEDKCKD